MTDTTQRISTRYGWLALGALAFGLPLLGGSCTSPATQLVVVVDTPLMIPAELDAIEIAVTGPSGIQTSSVEDLSAAGAPALPLSLGVSPSADALGPLDVIAIGRLDGVEIVRTTARVTLTEGETRVLTLSLVRGCIGRSCGAGETCGPGGCQPIQRGELPFFDGTLPRYTMQDACDAMPWDEDGDGEASDMCGGLDCNDQDPSLGPGVPEACDTIDNNCDGAVDPDCECAPDGATESCTTVCGTTGVQTCEGGTFGECVLPEEVCNGIDDDCDGLIDEGSTYTGRDEQRISGAEGRNTAGPRIVAVDGGWRVVYSQPGFGGGQFMTRRDTPDSDWTEPFPVGSLGAEADFAVGDDGLMLTWTRREMVFTQSFDRLFVRPLDRDGTPSGPEVRIDPDVGTPARPRVMWDSPAFFRIAYYDGDLFVRSVNTDGTTMGAAVNVSGSNDNRADFTLIDGLYAAAWARGDSVYFLSADASLIPTQLTLEETNRAEHGSLDGSGDGYLVAWFDEVRLDGEPDTRSLRTSHLEGVSPSGVSTLLSPSTGGDGFPINDIEPATVRFGGGQYLVTWADQRDGDQEIYFARLSEGGEIVQGATRLTEAAGAADGTSAAFVDGRFGVVWSDLRGSNSEVFFAEVACAPAPP